MKAPLSAVALALGAGLGLSLWAVGCRNETDIGRPCNLVRSLDDGGLDFVKEEDITASGQTNKDIITIGAVECENQICVRDSTYKVTGAPGDKATGYCSNRCTPPGEQECDPENLDDQKKSATRVTCRGLLLDELTLANLRDNPLFRGITSPNFCARGAGDAGF